jgi:hypothetical protein
MTHSTQVGLRKKHVEEIQAKQLQQEDFRQSKNDEQFTAVSLIEAKLLAMIDDSADKLLVNCRIEYFARVKSAELAAFIYAHDPAVKLKNQIPKNMGKLEDAKAAIERGVLLENNQIYTAYQCRDKPNILNAKHKSAQPKSSQNEEVEHTLEDVTTVILFSNDNDDGILPSKLLEHEEWLKRMHILFGIDDMLESFSVTNAIKAKGDNLVKILRGRMKQLLKK